MMTFLDLTNALIRELGVNGGQQLTGIGASSNTPEALRIAGYVADADFRVQSLYNNWSFMWRKYSNSILTGNVITKPNYLTDFYVFRLFDRDSLVLYPGTSQAYSPTFMPWREFQKMYGTALLVTSAYPTNWSISPSRQIVISAVAPAAMPYTFEGWAMPFRMKNDGDVSPIVRYNSTHQLNLIVAESSVTNQVVGGYATASANDVRDYDGRIIIARAMMIYAISEGADEVMRGGTAEYIDTLKELQSTALPGQDSDWASESDLADCISPFL